MKEKRENPQANTPDTPERPAPKGKKRPRFLLRLIAAVLILAVALGAVAAVV